MSERPRTNTSRTGNGADKGRGYPADLQRERDLLIITLLCEILPRETFKTKPDQQEKQLAAHPWPYGVTSFPHTSPFLGIRVTMHCFPVRPVNTAFSKWFPVRPWVHTVISDVTGCTHPSVMPSGFEYPPESLLASSIELHAYTSNLSNLFFAIFPPALAILTGPAKDNSASKTFQSFCPWHHERKCCLDEAESGHAVRSQDSNSAAGEWLERDGGENTSLRFFWNYSNQKLEVSTSNSWSGWGENENGALGEI